MAGVISEVEGNQAEAQSAKMLEATVLKGYELIYSDTGVAEMVSKNPANKVEDVATAGYIVIQKINRSEQQAGRPPIPDQVLGAAGYHIIDKLVELAEHQGVQFSEEEEKAALQSAYQKYISDGIKNRTINPAELAQAVENTPEGKGKIQEAMAGIPDTPAGVTTPPPPAPGSAGPSPVPGGAPEGAPEGAPPPTGASPDPAGPAPGGAPSRPQGLLSQPSPLERFLR